MSIYASLPGITPDEPCGPPWQYQGSHILPADDHPRGGELGLALIPSHITRDGRDDQPEDGAPWPWLRLSLDDLRTADPTVLLDRAQVAHLVDQLTAWYDSTGDPAAPEQHCGEECAEGHVYAGRWELAPEQRRPDGPATHRPGDTDPDTFAAKALAHWVPACDSGRHPAHPGVTCDEQDALIASTSRFLERCRTTEMSDVPEALRGPHWGGPADGGGLLPAAVTDIYAQAARDAADHAVAVEAAIAQADEEPDRA